jgi:hypothetical protein
MERFTIIKNEAGCKKSRPLGPMGCKLLHPPLDSVENLYNSPNPKRGAI